MTNARNMAHLHIAMHDACGCVVARQEGGHPVERHAAGGGQWAGAGGETSYTRALPVLG